MADPRHQPDQEEEHDGASPSELLIEAARRNNTDLLQEVIASAGGPEKAALLLNETKTVMGNYIYHEAALQGNYEIIDMLLDQEGFECDPISRLEGDSPLHSAVRYINSLPTNPETADFAQELISMMVEAGNDPRLKNRASLSPAQLVDPRNAALKRQLEDAIAISQNAGDYTNTSTSTSNNNNRDPELAGGAAHGEEEHDDDVDDYAGSASDSDFDPEEFRRERERRRKEEKEAGGKGKGS